MLLASYNIRYGIGADDRYDLRRAVGAVAHADIIAFQEVDVGWARTDHDDQVAAIAALLPDHALAWGPNIDTLSTAGQGMRRQHGNLIASRHPILSIRNFLLPKYGALDYLDQQKGVLEALIDTPDGPVRVYSTHFCSTAPAQSLIQAEWLLAHHRTVRGRGPVLAGINIDPSWTSEPALPPMPDAAIVMGDLNFKDTAPAYEVLVGDYSPRYGNLTRRDGFLDAWVACNSDVPRDRRAESGATVLAGERKRVDYCLVTPDLRARLRDCRVALEADGSDHQPIFLHIGDA